MPAISPTLNDGVVNTVRQIVPPGRREEVGGFVVADHGDVLGHYDRQDALIGGNPYNTGLFHSGAAFGDDEFFGLYRRVAQAILKTVPGAHREEEAPELDVVSIQHDPSCAPAGESAASGPAGFADTAKSSHDPLR